jgi:NAD(P)-dependent dehydrogenase (short-subunit alcohol dehydrogenase family)
MWVVLDIRWPTFISMILTSRYLSALELQNLALSLTRIWQNGEIYNGWKAYGQAKSAQLLGTRGLANRLKAKGIAVLAAHPGGIGILILPYNKNRLN